MIDNLNKNFKKYPEKVVTNTTNCLIAIDQKEDKLNAFVTITGVEALVEAKESAKRYKDKSSLGKMDGITVSIKDIICTKDLRTTASSNMLIDFVPPYDATVVDKMKKAGMVILGKNNCDAWAHGASTENSDFGVTVNPHDGTRVSGGSSGGSAAAVAALESNVSVGTDTGGSIRQPAGFCGVVGLKPTYGRVSRYGVIAMASSLDCVGPIANNCEDAALLLSIIAGKDKLDSTTVEAEVPKYEALINQSLKGKKIGWVKDIDEDLSPDIKQAFKKAKDVFVSLGVDIVTVELPHLKYSVPTYYIIQTAEVSSNLGRYDGIKYGHSSDTSTSLIDHYFRSRDEGFGTEAKRRIMLGTFVLSAGYYDAYYAKAMKVRTLIKNDFDRVLTSVDSILMPVSPTTAFKVGEKSKNPIEMYLADIYTAAVNLAGNPGLSLPCGQDKNCMPIGMQLIGRHFDEATILAFGHQYENKIKN